MKEVSASFRSELIDDIFSLVESSDERFNKVAARVRTFQHAEVPAFARFLDSAGDPAAYVPADIFKFAGPEEACSGKPELVFESSGTHGTKARHYVRSEKVYRRSVTTAFRLVFGPKRRLLLAHLPGYSDNPHSSLVKMLHILIEEFGLPGSGFFLEDRKILKKACADDRPVVVFGAAFGLLDLIENEYFQLPVDSVVVETGGMKTRRKELLRSDLHKKIAIGFGIDAEQVWSEYGMCELLSQAYATKRGVFQFPPWVRWHVVSPSDPAVELPEGQEGVLRLIDLANIDSIAFLIVPDRVVQRGEGFEVLGRWDPADLRGCNFLLES